MRRGTEPLRTEQVSTSELLHQNIFFNYVRHITGMEGSQTIRGYELYGILSEERYDISLDLNAAFTEIASKFIPDKILVDAIYQEQQGVGRKALLMLTTSKEDASLVIHMFKAHDDKKINQGVTANITGSYYAPFGQESFKISQLGNDDRLNAATIFSEACVRLIDPDLLASQ